MAKYLYGIVEGEEGKGFPSIPSLPGGVAVYPVAAPPTGLLAVVKDVAQSRNGAKRSDGASSEADALEEKKRRLEHHEVVLNLMERCDIIPLHYGTVVGSDREVAAFLTQGEGVLREIFKMIRGKVEYTFEAAWQNKQVIQELVVQNPAIAEAKARISGREMPPTIEEVIAIGKLVQEEVALHNARVSEQVKEMLTRLDASQVSLPPETERTILAYAVLIPRGKVDAFQEALHSLRDSYGEKIMWTCHGPFPPYHFIQGKFELVTQEMLVGARAALGLRDDFSLTELKEAYREQARESHPDQHRGDAPAGVERRAQFEKIETAYRLLRKSVNGQSQSGSRGSKACQVGTEGGSSDFLLFFAKGEEMTKEAFIEKET